MSTIKKANERAKAAKAPAEPIDIDAAMARLILLRKFHELPRPVSYEISTGEYGTFQGIYVYVHTSQNVTAWADALGVDEHSRGSFTGHDGSVNFDATRRDWNGWYVRVVSKAPYPAPAPSELDADTVASLEEVASGTVQWRTYTGAEYDSVTKISCFVIANGELVDEAGDPIHEDHPQISAEILRRGTDVYREHAYAKVPTFGCDHSEAAEPKPLVSDATIAEAEQISRMVAPMDLALPAAPCGCPIKGDELSTYVDHCEACKAVSA